MKIRTAHPHEIPALVTTGDQRRDTDTAEYLTNILEAGCTRPEWCFVSEEAGQLTRSIVLWTRPGHDTPTDFVLYEADWNDPDTARAILEHAVTTARALGADALSHVLDTPAQAPQHQTHPKAREELLRASGFDIARDGMRWQWQTGDPIPGPDERLTWRSHAELGSEPFIDLLEELIADTRDSLIQADIDELGLRGAAELLWRESSEMEHEDSWFEIGYDADGSAAAISLPSRNPTVAVIGFVGVSPRHRGKGYSATVVARGTRILAGAGAEVIRGDCDRGNPAMAKGFARAGYANFSDRKAFRKSL